MHAASQYSKASLLCCSAPAIIEAARWCTNLHQCAISHKRLRKMCSARVSNLTTGERESFTKREKRPWRRRSAIERKIAC